MTNILLLLLLVLLFALSYKAHGKQVSPSGVFILAFTISAAVFFFLQFHIQYELSLESVLIIFFILIAFFIGECVSTFMGSDTQKRKGYKEIIYKQYFPKIALFIQVVNLLLGYKYIMQVGALYGASDFFSAYAANRLHTLEFELNGEVFVERPTLLRLSLMLADAFEIISLQIVMMQKMLLKTKVDKFLFVSVFLYFLSLFFNSGRSAFYPFVFSLLFFFFRYYEGKIRLSFFRKHLAPIALIVVIGGFLWMFLGSVRQESSLSGDVEYEFNPAMTVAVYVGSPLAGFDIYVKKDMPANEYYGENTFKGIYDVLRKFGIINQNRPVLHEEKFYLKEVEANVYTGLYAWIKDFRLWGAIIFSLFVGFASGILYNWQKKNIIKFDSIIGNYVLITFYSSLVMMFYNSQFYNFFSVDFIIYKLLLLTILIRAFTSKRSVIAQYQL